MKLGELKKLMAELPDDAEIVVRNILQRAAERKGSRISDIGIDNSTIL